MVSSECPDYGDIREKFENMDDDSDLVEQFNLVLARRNPLDGCEEENEEDMEMLWTVARHATDVANSLE